MYINATTYVVFFHVFYLCSIFGQEFWCGDGQEPRDGCSLSLSVPLMLVAFVKIWSDEREIVVLWRERGKMAGKKEKRGNSGLKCDIA